MESKLLIAIVAAGGTLAGVIVNSVVQLSRDWFKERPERRLAKLRKELLKQMLNDERWKWRKLSTLSHVIGSDEYGTKLLLIEIGARASTDGSQQWGLISRNPLPDNQ